MKYVCPCGILYVGSKAPPPLCISCGRAVLPHNIDWTHEEPVQYAKNDVVPLTFLGFKDVCDLVKGHVKGKMYMPPLKDSSETAFPTLSFNPDFYIEPWDGSCDIGGVVGLQLLLDPMVERLKDAELALRNDAGIQLTISQGAVKGSLESRMAFSAYCFNIDLTDLAHEERLLMERRPSGDSHRPSTN